MATEAGRDPASIPVTLFAVPPDVALLKRYRDLGIARELDGLLRAVGIDTRDHGHLSADFFEGQGQRPLALLARERGHLGGVPIGHDPRHPLRIGEPAQVLLVGRHVDLQIGGEGEQVRGNAAREAEPVVHGQKRITGRALTATSGQSHRRAAWW